MDTGKKPYLATHLTYPELMDAMAVFEADHVEGCTFRRMEFKQPYKEGVANKLYPDYPTMVQYFDHPFIYDETPVFQGREKGRETDYEDLHNLLFTSRGIKFYTANGNSFKVSD
jgi:hypothetical protein